MNNLLSQIVQMGLNLLYGFVLLDEKEQALQSIEVMVQLARYLGKSEGGVVSLEDENNHLLELIQLKNLKTPKEFSLIIDMETEDKNIYIERFSVFNKIAPQIMNDNKINHGCYQLKYRQNEMDLDAELLIKNETVLDFNVKIFK